MMERRPGKMQAWWYEYNLDGRNDTLLDGLSMEGSDFAAALCAHCERNRVRC